jgi:hypothetical protein
MLLLKILKMHLKLRAHALFLLRLRRRPLTVIMFSPHAIRALHVIECLTLHLQLFVKCQSLPEFVLKHSFFLLYHFKGFSYISLIPDALGCTVCQRGESMSLG